MATSKKTTQVTSVEELIEAFGGPRSFASFTGFNEKTVISWKGRGVIPAEHWRTVIDAGRVMNPPLKLTIEGIYVANYGPEADC